MNVVVEAVIAAHIILGGIFALVGSIGMVRLPDLMTRLHAPTKATTVGLGGFLIASMIYFFAASGSPSVHEILVTFFLFLTAPITAHFVAKTYILHHVNPKKDLPPTGQKTGWGTFESLPESEPASDKAVAHPKP